MKRYIYTILASCIFTLLPIEAMAQAVESAYFTDGFLYRHDLNPALGNDSSTYISMPAIGNVNITMGGNFGIKDVLFNRNGSTHTFLSPTVSLDEFMNGIKDNNKVVQDLNMQIFGVGFKGIGGYNTIEVNVRENTNVKIPGTLLELAKTGLQNDEYDINDFKVKSQAYAEIALGHSHQITDKLRIGGKLKFLIGGENVDAKFNEAKISLGEDGYTAVVDAEINASIKGLQYKYETKEVNEPVYDANHKVIGYTVQERQYINDVDIKGAGPNGFGLAVDLGVEYKFDDDWKVSASLMDLGFISWKENYLATSYGNVNTDDYVFNPDEKSQMSFDNAFQTLGDDIAKIYQLQDKGNTGSKTTGIGTTMHVAFEYTTPFYRGLSFGLLNTTRFQSDFTWTNFRLSANIAPCKIFSGGVNFAMGTYGFGLGAIANLHCKGFNLFLATDHTLGKMAKQWIPLSSNGNLSFGMNFII